MRLPACAPTAVGSLIATFLAARVAPAAVWARFASSIVVGCFVLCLAVTASAQSYPDRPIKLIVPFAAGGPLDFVGRSIGDKLSISLKQPIIIENRVGAGGNIGTEAAAKSPPDGYTLLLVLSGTLVANPAVFATLPFDPERDFAPISLLSATSQMLVVHPALPVDTAAAFVAHARTHTITYAHAGPGSGGHLAMGYFRLLAGFGGTPVPYRGNAPLMNDLAAGQVQSGFIASAGAIPHVRAGRLKGLAISSEKRSPLAPDVPTVAEAGFPEMKLNTWFVLLAPAKTPPPILALLEREVRKAVTLNLPPSLRVGGRVNPPPGGCSPGPGSRHEHRVSPALCGQDGLRRICSPAAIISCKVFVSRRPTLLQRAADARKCRRAE